MIGIFLTCSGHWVDAPLPLKLSSRECGYRRSDLTGIEGKLTLAQVNEAEIGVRNDIR
jgi:hypothetical protein